MKIWFMFAFAVTILCLVLCLTQTKKSSKKIANSGRKVLLIGIVSVLCNLVQMLSDNRLVYDISYSLFFASIDWLLFYFLMFTVEYTGFPIKKYTSNPVVWMILGIDTLSLILNPVFGHAYTCVQILTEQNEIYYQFTPHLPYYIHLGISYVLVTMITLRLIWKMIKAPLMYRRRYWMVLLFFSLVVVGDAAHLILHTSIDVSVIGFAAAGISVYYYSIVYVSIDLLNRLFMVVVEEMNNGILLFDMNGECVYVNSEGRKMMDLPENAENEDADIACRQWFEEHCLSSAKEFTYEWKKSSQWQTQHIRVRLQRLKDKHERDIGFIIQMQDRTLEANELFREHQLATRDPLTNVYNRQFFYEQATEYLKAHQEEDFLIICSDIKNFKLLNEVFGAETGDTILIRIAEELRKRTVSGEIYGRLGDDHFALLMRRKDFRESVFAEAQNKLIRLEADATYPIYIYIGVYAVTDVNMPVSTMCEHAMTAISRIKGTYQKKIAYYDDILEDNALLEQELLSDFDYAMEQQQFIMFLQPQVTEDGNVPGAEALVRWQHPKRGMMMPGEFIAIFEKNGMIAKLDPYVWELACRQLSEWKAHGRDDLYISVNISPKDFYFLDIYRVFTDLVQKYDVNPANLKLELTETVIAENPEQQQLLIEQLRHAGFIVEMNDFGNGYSSLNLLKDISVDVLKVDIGFLNKSSDEARSREVLKMIVNLSTKLDMPVIAERVETEEQVKFLSEIGCHIYQGFYFAQPMPVEEFEQDYM